MQTFFQFSCTCNIIYISFCLVYIFACIYAFTTNVVFNRENGPRILCNKYAPEHLRRLQDFEQSSHLLRNFVTEGESIATEDTQKPGNTMIVPTLCTFSIEPSVRF